MGAAWLLCLTCATSNEDEFVRAAREVPASLKRRKEPVQHAGQPAPYSGEHLTQDLQEVPGVHRWGGGQALPRALTPEDYLRSLIKLPF